MLAMPTCTLKNSDSLQTASPAPAGLIDAASLTSEPKRPPWATARIEQRMVESMVSDDTKLFRELERRGVSEATVRAHARAIGMTWEFIKQCRLSESRPGMRVCINCDVRFLSSGIDNRLCRRCGRR